MPAAPRSLRLLTAATITLAVLWPLSAFLLAQVQLCIRGSAWGAGIADGSFNVGRTRMPGLEKGPSWVLNLMVTSASMGSGHSHFYWWVSTTEIAKPELAVVNYGIPIWAPLLVLAIPTAFAWRRHRAPRAAPASHGHGI